MDSIAKYDGHEIVVQYRAPARKQWRKPLHAECELFNVGASTEIEMTEELVVKSVKLTGGRHLAVHLSNRADVAVGIGNLRYTLTDKAGNRDAHSTPNATPVHPGETVEIFIEVHESVRSLDFIGYELQSARIIPVQGRAEAGFWRWTLKIR